MSSHPTPGPAARPRRLLAIGLVLLPPLALAAAAPPATAAVPNLAVTMTGPASVAHGSTATYTTTVANTGTAAASDVVVRYVLIDKSGQALPKPANLTPLGGSTIDAATATAGSCTTGTAVGVAPLGPVGPAGPVAPGGYTPRTATCRIGSVAGGATATVTITVGAQLNTFLVVQPAGALVSEAAVYSDDNATDDATEAATVAARTADEPSAADNVATVATTVTP